MITPFSVIQERMICMLIYVKAVKGKMLKMLLIFMYFIVITLLSVIEEKMNCTSTCLLTSSRRKKEIFPSLLHFEESCWKQAAFINLSLEEGNAMIRFQ